MPLFDTVAIVGAIALIALMVVGTVRDIQTPARGLWLIPGVICLAFTGWSGFAIFTEGPLGFWVEHTRNGWGVQIWFDLVIAILIAWTVLLPRARAVGMSPIPWMVLILCTGCIGLSAMVARVFYLEGKAAT